MILRRVITHFRKQEWTAIALDFLIVVVGVFVGIQVSNWNAARLESKESIVFTERLRHDLRQEAWNYVFLIEYSGTVRANAERVVDALTGEQELSDEALLIDAYRATQFQRRLHRQSTLDELTSTGEIGLIRDDRLRETAIRMFSTGIFDRTATQGSGSRYREAFRMTIPNKVQRALRDNCGDRYVAPGDPEAVAGSLDYECATGLGADAIAEAAEALRTHDGLVPMLRLRIADIETQVADLRSNHRDILEVLAADTGDGP